MAKRALAVTLAGALVVLGFFFWISGGFDLFKSPVEIVIPAGYSGVVCAKLLADGSANRYEVSSNGLLLISEEALRSHRRFQFLTKLPASDAFTVLPNDAMFSIFTETDVSKNVAYTVFWAGTPASWSSFNDTRRRDPLCIGRF
jgi:hypothetical protein